MFLRNECSKKFDYKNYEIERNHGKILFFRKNSLWGK